MTSFSDFDRRSFIGISATAAAGMTVQGRLARAAMQANRTVSVGVMGLSRGLSLANSFSRMENVDVKYVCDVDDARAKRGENSINKNAKIKTKAITDFREILDDKACDVLVCAAPNHWHGPATIMGCSAGKHVYVEKPCSHNPAEGEMMIAAARKYNRCVQMGTQRRSSPAIIEGMQKLHDGAIGRVYHARCYYASLRGPTIAGKQAKQPDQIDLDLWQGPAPRVPEAKDFVHYNWHWRWHWGNGELGNNGVHSLDLCRWAIGVDYPIRVVSSGGRYRYEDDQQTPDTHVVAFEFDNKSQITWQGASCNRHRFPFAVAFGEKGSMEILSNGYTLFDTNGKELDKKTSGVGQEEHVTNFIDAIRSDDPKSLNQEIESGHKSTLLCHLGNIAHRTGRTINCDAKNGHITGDEEAMNKYWSRDYEKGWEPKV